MMFRNGSGPDVSEPAAIDCTTAGRSGGNTARISPSLKLAAVASTAADS